MRIYVSGAGRWREYNVNQIDDFLFELRDSILAEIRDDAFGLSELRFEILQRKLSQVVREETQNIFQTAVDIISKPVRSYTYRGIQSPLLRSTEVTAFDSNLFGPRTLADMAMMPMGGSVQWRDLTVKWAQKKRRTRPGTEDKFFIHTGSLLNWLRRPKTIGGKAGGFGGVVVQRVKMDDLKQRRLSRGDKEWALAQLSIQVYPNIPAMLLPMLTQFDWRASSEGLFEKRMIGGMIGEKLAGPEGYHRPLLQPLTQFWIAYRLPRVVAMTVRNVMKASPDVRPA